MTVKQAKRYGIIGTSCAGKTTLAHTLVGRLKSYGVLADGIFSQDRKLPFSLNYIESELAQNWMIGNIVAQETAMTLREDVDILISDRTPLDLMAYYLAQHTTELSDALLNYAIAYCKGYEAIYYLEPLPYQADGKRPTDEFRINVDIVLKTLIQRASENGVNIKRLPRPDVLKDIIKSASIRKPSVKDTLSPLDYQVIANTLQRTILAKETIVKDTLTDHDVWVVYKDLNDYNNNRGTLPKVAELLQSTFGVYVNLDLHATLLGELSATLTFPHTTYHPEGNTK